MEKQYKRPESVLIVVYSSDGQVLLLRRRDNPSFWQSVTGSMSHEETHPAMTAWRELAEETGLTTKDGQMQDCQQQEWFAIYNLWRFRYHPEVTQNLEHVFCFQLPFARAILLSHEHLEYQWVDKKIAVTKVFSETNQKAIERFIINKETI